jgi:hypothetical protein
MVGAELRNELVGNVADMHSRTARDEKIADGTTDPGRSRGDQDTQILLQSKRIYVPVHSIPQLVYANATASYPRQRQHPCVLPAACTKSQDGVNLAPKPQAPAPWIGLSAAARSPPPSEYSIASLASTKSMSWYRPVQRPPEKPRPADVPVRAGQGTADGQPADGSGHAGGIAGC